MVSWIKQSETVWFIVVSDEMSDSDISEHQEREQRSLKMEEHTEEVCSDRVVVLRLSDYLRLVPGAVRG